MELKEIMSISGQPGLFKYLSQGKNGIIVEGISDTKRTFVPQTSRVSSLAEIAIFSDSGEVALKTVFKTIREKVSGAQILNHKSDEKEIRSFFETILPDYDRDKVYASDIRKVISWYNILQEKDLLSILDIEDKEDTQEEVAEKGEAKKDMKHNEKAVAAKAQGTKSKMAPKQTNIAQKAGSASRKTG